MVSDEKTAQDKMKPRSLLIGLFRPDAGYKDIENDQIQQNLDIQKAEYCEFVVIFQE